MMEVTAQTQAVLLLTACFSRPGKDDPKPLTVREWGRFAHWLKDHSLKPEQIVLNTPKDLLSRWHDKTITSERIERLIDRGPAMALAMEKWTRAGLWVLTRSNSQYPARLKKKLGADSPALFFGCGNATLLDQGGISVIGSRSASNDDLEFATGLGRRAAEQGYSIVSGGARGIDEAAMLSALEADGTVVGILADSLLRASSSQKYRRHLMAKNLVLVSPFYPEAGFSAGNAMSRNKHIYCLSDAAIVVHSGRKGGTWTGSLEAIRHEWVPVWVKETRDSEAGNEGIIGKGGLRLQTPVADIQFSRLLQSAPVSSETADLLSVHDQGEKTATVATKTTSVVATKPAARTDLSDISLYELFSFHVGDLCREGPKPPEEIAKALGINTLQAKTWLRQVVADGKFDSPDCTDLSEVALYELFLAHVIDLCRENPRKPTEIAETLALKPSQANLWLKQAVSEIRLTKLSKPVLYAVPEQTVAPDPIPAPDQTAMQSDLFAGVEDS